MATFDFGGGCSCGLYKVCICKQTKEKSMSIPFEEILSKLSPERQKKIEERAKELIEEQEKLLDCDILISASSGATELAEFYNTVESVGIHHKLSYGPFLAAIRQSIINQAGIPDEYVKTNILIDTIKTYKVG